MRAARQMRDETAGPPNDEVTMAAQGVRQDFLGREADCMLDPASGIFLLAALAHCQSNHDDHCGDCEGDEDERSGHEDGLSVMQVHPTPIADRWEGRCREQAAKRASSTTVNHQVGFSAPANG